MAPIWIEAALALDIAANGGSKTAAQYTLCERAHASLIRTNAKLLVTKYERKENIDLPSYFWWAEGHEALEQNWATGDFSTWAKERSVQMQAFGVHFAFEDVLEILPVEQRALVARRHSVAGNPLWMSATDAWKSVGRREGLQYHEACRKLIEEAKLGFVTARAAQMRSGSNPDQITVVEREWDVPTWFWQHYVEKSRSSQEWTTGKFKGRPNASMPTKWIELTGVYFLRSTIETENDHVSDGESNVEKWPDLSAADLERWWKSMAKARDSLSQKELLLLVRQRYPEKFISRDRIRDLATGRKPGKKPISD